ncbi:MAG: trypsin-like serine protease [Alphaproteobacteria bacterium]|nr:trypsin-like serine protease [Alphaproteobacteria bacterium]
MIALVLSMAFGQELKIVNGTEVTGQDYPEVVAVQGASSICTGSLIHPEWVLTACHCFDGVNIADVPDGDTTVFFGNSVTGAGTRISADQVYIHPDYCSIGFSPNAGDQDGDGMPDNCSPGGTQNDVALVHLAEPYPGQIMALNESDLDDAWIGLDITHIGFGITTFQGSGSGVKRYTDSYVDSFTDRIVQTFDPQTGNGTCQGDSGGPTVRYQGDGYIQIGVTAFGTICGTAPGSHMRVDAYVPFIRQTIAPAEILTVAARPPDFECSHQLNPGEDDSIALGVVPMNLRCEVFAADPENITNVSWSWGDGESSETTDLRSEHTYTTQGVYSLSACITTNLGGTEFEHCVNKTNHVNACDVPEAAFEATPADGLTVDLVNKTPLRAYTCISNATWEVYEGTSVGGTPVRTLSGWEPDLDLSEEGPGDYTIVLNVGGLGGTGAAMTNIKVGRGAGCAHVPGWSWAFVAPLFLVGLSRRRD